MQSIKQMFGGKKMRSMTVNPSICGFAGLLLTKKMLFYDSELRTFDPTVWFNVWTESIQLFVCALNMHSKEFTFLKYLKFLAFPMTISGSFSPAAFAPLILAHYGSLFLTCRTHFDFTVFTYSVFFTFQFKCFVS